MRIWLSVPAGNERGPLYVEQAFAALQRLLPRWNSVAFGYAFESDEVRLYVECRERLAVEVLRQLRAVYPDLAFRIEPKGEIAAGRRSPYLRRSLCLSRSARLRTWDAFIDSIERSLSDPIAGVLNALSDREVECAVCFLVRRRRGDPRRLWHLIVGRPWAGGSPGGLGRSTPPPFSVRIELQVKPGRGEGRAVQRKLAEIESTLAQFCDGPRTRLKRRRPWRRSSLLTVRELATLWHLPLGSVRTDRLERSPYRRLAPPAVLPEVQSESDVAVLGRVDFANRDEVFGIRADDRLRHLAVVGKTGMGKSTLLRQLIVADIASDRGAALVDPHGDLAQEVADAVPSRRTNDVIYFDAADRSHPLAFNPLACRSEHERPLLASGVVSAFKRLYGGSWGPRLEHILRNGLLAVLEQPDPTLLSLQRLLTDSAFRSKTAGSLRDPVVRAFWADEFAHWKPQLQAEATAPVLNKLGQFLSHPTLRLILAQGQDRLNIRRAMDERLVLIANLSKGLLGEDAAMLLGAFLVTQLQLAAMSRADVPQNDRVPFYAYIDEFQNFISTDSFATILSEARKYGLALTVAHQYLDQLDEPTRHAVFGNVGSLMAFQVGATDADVLAEQLGAPLQASDLTGLPKHTAYVRLLIDGLPSRPFSIRTLPPDDVQVSGRLPVIRRVSRHRYARSASAVEREIEDVFAVST